MSISPSAFSLLAGRCLITGFVPVSSVALWVTTNNAHYFQSLERFLLPHKARFSTLCSFSQCHRQAWSSGSHLIAPVLTLRLPLLPFMPGIFPLGWVRFTSKGGPHVLQRIQEGDVQTNKQIKQIPSVTKPNFNCTSYLTKCMGPKHWHCLCTTTPS